MGLVLAARCTHCCLAEQRKRSDKWLWKSRCIFGTVVAVVKKWHWCQRNATSKVLGEPEENSNVFRTLMPFSIVINIGDLLDLVNISPCLLWCQTGVQHRIARCKNIRKRLILIESALLLNGLSCCWDVRRDSFWPKPNLANLVRSTPAPWLWLWWAAAAAGAATASWQVTGKKKNRLVAWEEQRRKHEAKGKDHYYIAELRVGRL
jgi:hypothetical protein